MYLLDTNIISEYRKITKGAANSHFVQWQKDIPLHHLYLSGITIMELNIGILCLMRKDKVQGEKLKSWLNYNVLPNFKGRILAFDVQTALMCSQVHESDPKPDRDSMIAATAKEHNLVLVTRNIKDFQAIDIQLINPFD